MINFAHKTFGPKVYGTSSYIGVTNFLLGVCVGLHAAVLLRTLPSSEHDSSIVTVTKCKNGLLFGRFLQTNMSIFLIKTTLSPRTTLCKEVQRISHENYNEKQQNPGTCTGGKRTRHSKRDFFLSLQPRSLEGGGCLSLPPAHLVVGLVAVLYG